MIRVKLADIERPAGRRPHREHPVEAVTIPLVVKPASDRYILICGEDRLAAAMPRAELEPEIDALTPGDVLPADLERYAALEGYRCRVLDPIALGRVLLRWAALTPKQSMSSRGRSIGVSVPFMHHHEAVVRSLAPTLHEPVADGRISFRLARELADIPGHERQIGLAEALQHNKLRGPRAYNIVGLAKKYPRLAVEELVIMSGKELPPIPERQRMSFHDLERIGVRFAGMLDRLRESPVPEIERVRYARLLSMVGDKLTTTQGWLLKAKYQ